MCEQEGAHNLNGPELPNWLNFSAIGIGMMDGWELNVEEIRGARVMELVSIRVRRFGFSQ